MRRKQNIEFKSRQQTEEQQKQINLKYIKFKIDKRNNFLCNNYNFNDQFCFLYQTIHLFKNFLQVMFVKNRVNSDFDRLNLIAFSSEFFLFT